jgi:catechol 2,3-dioxygenase-like lactoylglutathione lyase family enzyme
VTVVFDGTTPALPSADVGRSVAFYRDVLGFEALHAEEGFAVLRRDAATLNVWGATDDSWHDRSDWARPVVSGAESFIAGTASCRVRVHGVDELYAHCVDRGIVHPNAHIEDTDWGTREFGTLDPDGNLVSFFEERSA